LGLLNAQSAVLVTGASGFLGRHCLERLLGEPCRIHAVNRSGAGPGGDRVRWHAADLRDPAAAARLVAEIRPTHLLHAAWIAIPGVFWKAPENLDWLAAGLALARAFGEAGGLCFLGLGSCAEYDWRAGRFAEDETPIRPATLYGKAKAAMWTALEACAALYGFCASWGRIFLPYGSGDAPERLIPTVIDRLRRGQPVPLSEASQERDFIYAPDAADLMVRLLAVPLPGPFNIATGRGVSVRRAVEYVADRLGGRDRLEFGARPALVEEPARLVGDMAKVEALVGWSAPTALEAGLDRVLALAGIG
jgi:nucleoside-diphosphate-sugar epimerase